MSSSLFLGGYFLEAALTILLKNESIFELVSSDLVSSLINI